MENKTSQSRMVWLAAGLLAGLAVTYFWPHQPVMAVTSDRSDKFAMTTVAVTDVTIGGFRDTLEGVFVLDFLTGRLVGSVIAKNGQFTHSYRRDLADDFEIKGNIQPQYAIVTGNAIIPQAGPQTPATGIIYVGELTTGKVIAYGFFYSVNRGGLQPLQPIDSFQFRESVNR